MNSYKPNFSIYHVNQVHFVGTRKNKKISDMLTKPTKINKENKY